MRNRTLLALCSLAVLAAPVSRAQSPGGAAVAPGDERHAKIYDVGGVFARLQEGAGMESVPSVAGTGNLARLVAAFVEPPLREDEVVQPLGERWITVLGRAEQHAWISRFLAKASLEDDSWAVTSRLVRLPEIPFQLDVLPALRRPDAHAVPSSVVLAPGEDTDAFVKALLEHEQAKVAHSPRVVQGPFQAACVSVIGQTSYVKDFEVETAKGLAVANPVIDVIQDGYVMSSSLVPLGPDVVGISVDASIADLQKPIPEFETSLGAGQPVTIQLPEVLRTGVESAAELPAGHRLLLVLPRVAGTRYLVLVSVERLD